MNLSLQVSTQAGTTVIRLFRDPNSPKSYKEFACTVTSRGRDYRSDIPAPELQELLHAVRSAKISLVGNSPQGLDGTSYELTVEEGGAQATYCWWSHPDKGWHPLVEIARTLLNLGFKVSGLYLP